MRRVSIVDYGAGNLGSVRRAFEECGAVSEILEGPSELKKAEMIVLPGVGAFHMGMKNLRERNLIEPLSEAVLDRKIPVLGICLGMQLMASSGAEGSETPGLDWISGRVERLKINTSSYRIPHMGWNEVHYSKPSPLFRDIADGTDFYFVHSFHFATVGSENELASTSYSHRMVSVVGRDHIFGLQFHPEKSQRPGFQLLRNFLGWEG